MKESQQTNYSEVPLTSPPTSVRPPDDVASVPDSIGRYRVVRLPGQGGFGRVFQAHDDELDRAVAVKVPHPHLIARPADIDTYLAEARVLASLDHPSIVPVYDVGRSGELCWRFPSRQPSLRCRLPRRGLSSPARRRRRRQRRPSRRRMASR